MTTTSAARPALRLRADGAVLASDGYELTADGRCYRSPVDGLHRLESCLSRDRRVVSALVTFRNLHRDRPLVVGGGGGGGGAAASATAAARYARWPAAVPPGTSEMTSVNGTARLVLQAHRRAVVVQLRLPDGTWVSQVWSTRCFPQRWTAALAVLLGVPADVLALVNEHAPELGDDDDERGALTVAQQAARRLSALPAPAPRARALVSSGLAATDVLVHWLGGETDATVRVLPRSGELELCQGDAVWTTRGGFVDVVEAGGVTRSLLADPLLVPRTITGARENVRLLAALRVQAPLRVLQARAADDDAPPAPERRGGGVDAAAVLAAAAAATERMLVITAGGDAPAAAAGT